MWIRHIKCPKCDMDITGPFKVGQLWPAHRGSQIENCAHDAEIVDEDFTSERIELEE